MGFVVFIIAVAGVIAFFVQRGALGEARRRITDLERWAWSAERRIEELRESASVLVAAPAGATAGEQISAPPEPAPEASAAITAPEHASEPAAVPAPASAAAPTGVGQVAASPAQWSAGESATTPSKPTRSAPSMPKLTGGQLLSVLGGIFVLAGAITFYAMAVNRGWIGPSGEIAVGMAFGALLFGIGLRVAHTGLPNLRANDAGLIAAGAGAGVMLISNVAAVQRLDVYGSGVGLVVGLVIGAAVVAAALWEDSPLLAGFGIVAGLAAPMLVDAPTDTASLVLLSVALIAAVAVVVQRDWSWLGSVALVVTAPQVAAWAIVSADSGAQQHGALVVCGVVTAWWALLAAAAIGFDLRAPHERLRTSAVTLLFLASGTSTAIAAAALDAIEATQGTDGLVTGWLMTFGMIHIVVAAALLNLRRADGALIAVLTGVIGAGVLAAAAAVATGGPGRDAFWAVEAFFLLLVRYRYSDVRAGIAAGLVAALVLFDALLVQVPPDRLADGAVDAAVALVALGSPLLAALACIWLVRRFESGVEQPAVSAADGDLLLADHVLERILVVISAVTAWWLATVIAVDAWGDDGRAIAWGLLALLVVIVERFARTRAVAAVAGALIALTTLDVLAEQLPPIVIIDGVTPTSTAVITTAPLLAALAVGLFVVRSIGVVAARHRDAAPDIDRLTDHAIGRALESLLALMTTWLATALMVTWIGPEGRIAAWTIAGAVLLSLVPFTLDRTTAILAGVATSAVLASALAEWATPSMLAWGSPDLLATIVSMLAVATLSAGAWIIADRVRIDPTEQARVRVLAIIVGGTSLAWAASIVVVSLLTPDADRLAHDVVPAAQVALSAFWALLGVGLVIVGLSRRLQRVHQVGAGLLLLAAAKLLVLDTAQLDSAARVAGFIAVGLLLLVGGFAYIRAQGRGDDAA